MATVSLNSILAPAGPPSRLREKITVIVINTVNQEAGGWAEVIRDKSLDSDPVKRVCVCVKSWQST